MVFRERHLVLTALVAVGAVVELELLLARRVVRVQQERQREEQPVRRKAAISGIGLASLKSLIGLGTLAAAAARQLQPVLRSRVRSAVAYRSS